MQNKSEVLIIDDDPAILKMTGEILRSDYVVSCVKSGAEAIALLSNEYLPDIILLDIDMPGLNGYDTLLRLQEMEDVRDIPVIYLTIMTQTEAELKGLSYGAVDYITKPFVKNILLARIKVHLENGRRLRRLSIIEKKEQNGGLDEEQFNKATADLTDTEKRIFRLILLGYTNQEIAQELYYSHGYVKKVAGIIYEKKQVNKRNDLIKLFKRK